jgi:hypothetical protein
MTLADVQELVSKVRFSGLFRGFRVHVELAPGIGTTFAEASRRADGEVLAFRLVGEVPDRETGVPGPVTHIDHLAIPALIDSRAGWRETVLDTVHHMVRGMARHEADESLTYDGIRLFDPHRSKVA